MLIVLVYMMARCVGNKCLGAALDRKFRMRPLGRRGNQAHATALQRRPIGWCPAHEAIQFLVFQKKWPAWGRRAGLKWRKP